MGETAVFTVTNTLSCFLGPELAAETMSKSVGKSLSITPFRRLVIDLMDFSRCVPSVTADRRMRLGALVEARQNCSPRPTWTSLFVKAYAIVAARTPILRRAYMKFPWARLYEHPKNVAAINVGRVVDGENVITQAMIRSPECRTISELDAIVHHYMTEPIENIKEYQRSKRLSRLPSPLRRLIWWLSLNLVGRRRVHNFGTFGISSVSSHGAGLLTLIPLLTTTLHHNLFDEHGNLEMRFGFDHRVLDGADAARALADLEKVLLGEILEEVRGMSVGLRRAA